MSFTTLNFILLLLTLAGHCHNPICTVTLPASHLSPSATHFSPTYHFLYFSLSSILLYHLLCRRFFPQSSHSSLVVFLLTLGPYSAHTTYLIDLAELHTPNIIALTETRVRNITKPAELIGATPPGYSLHSADRSSSSSKSNTITGGGTAFFIKEPATIINSSALSYSSFEYYYITLKLHNSKLSISI